MSRERFSDVIRFFRGFILSRPKIDDPSHGGGEEAADYATDGSYNVLFHGQANPRPFKGFADQGLVGGIYYSGPFGISQAPAYTLTVSSINPTSGIAVVITPVDINGSSDGTT